MNRPDVLALFAAQHWVAAWHQLQQLGITRSAVVTGPPARARDVAGAAVSSPSPASSCPRRSSAGRPAGGWIGVVRERADRRRAARVAQHAPAADRGDDPGAPPGHVAARSSTGPHELDRRATRRRRAEPTACGSPRRCAPCSGSAEQFKSIASSAPPRTCGTRVSSRPTRPAEYLATIRRSGRTGRHPHGDVAGADRHPPGDDAGAERVGAGVRRDDRTCGPADARCVNIRSSSPPAS